VSIVRTDPLAAANHAKYTKRICVYLRAATVKKLPHQLIVCPLPKLASRSVRCGPYLKIVKTNRCRRVRAAPD
jgi:hypothetical protein